MSGELKKIIFVYLLRAGVTECGRNKLQPSLYIYSSLLISKSFYRDAYETLQQLINGGNNTQDLDPRSVALIREAYNELLQEMASVDIDEKSIKSMLTPEAFDSV